MRRTSPIAVALLETARSPLAVTARARDAALLADPESLLGAARQHRLSNSLYLQVRSAPGASPALVQELRRAYLAQVAQHLRIEADLRWLADVLRDADVPFLVLKGIVIAESLYAPHPTARLFGDLDVVVPQASAAEAVRALVARGADVPSTDWSRLQAAGIAQTSLTLPSGSSLDLHWHLFSLPYARRAFAWPTDELFRDCRRVEIAGLEVDSLDGEDTLIHLCVHAALSGASELGRLVDLALLCAQADVDWSVVVRRAHERGLGLLCAGMLARTQRLLHADVPESVLTALHRRAGWRSLLTIADLVRPPHAVEPSHWTLAGLYRSLRPSLRGTLFAVGMLLLERSLSTSQRQRLWPLLQRYWTEFDTAAEDWSTPGVNADLFVEQMRRGLATP